jgi:small-conductance mechanosensitive channel
MSWWDNIWNWLLTIPSGGGDPTYGNLIKICVTIFVLLLIIVILRFIVAPQLRRAVKRGKIDDNARRSIQKIIRFVLILFYIILVFSLFASEASGLVTGIFAFSGATIIGFASMNTIGNAIAGLILMTTKPFRTGDRVKYQEKMADIIVIHFVFTRLRFLDGTEISVPNQEFLNKGIIKLGQKTQIVNRSIIFGLDYKLDPDMVIEEITELALENPNVEKSKDEEQLVSSSGTSKILVGISKLAQDTTETEHNLGPKVRVTKFLDYSVEYTLFFNTTVETGFKAENALRKAILIWSQNKGYDLSTTMQIKNM